MGKYDFGGLFVLLIFGFIHTVAITTVLFTTYTIYIISVIVFT